MGTSLNSNIISPVPGTSNKLINLDDNKYENCINLHEVPSQNIIIDNKVTKLKLMNVNIIKNKQVRWKKKSSFRKRIHRH